MAFSTCTSKSRSVMKIPLRVEAAEEGPGWEGLLSGVGGTESSGFRATVELRRCSTGAEGFKSSSSACSGGVGFSGCFHVCC